MFAGITQHPFEALRFAFSRLAPPSFTPINEALNVRPIHWIILAAILVVLVGLWRSLQRRSFGNEPLGTSSEIGTGWAFVGILVTGFAFGAIFQLWSGDSIRCFVRSWLDEDGQIIAVLIATLVFVGGGFAILFHLHEIYAFIRKRLRRKVPG